VIRKWLVAEGLYVIHSLGPLAFPVGLPVALVTEKCGGQNSAELDGEASRSSYSRGVGGRYRVHIKE